MADYLSYPGFVQASLDTEDDAHVENLKIRGYSVIVDAIPREQAEALTLRLDDAYRQQAAEYGEPRLKELNDSEIYRVPTAFDPVFANLIVNPKVLAVLDRFLGSAAIVHLQNASAAFPGTRHFQSAFHRDFAKDFVASKPLAMNAFYCMCDFTAINGATWVVPFSHKFATIPSDDYVERNAVQISAPAGSVLLWDSLLLHKAGENRTARVRYGVNHMFTRPFIKQQLDLTAYLQGKVEIESRLGQLLGFWSIPPKSVREYRVDHAQRTYRGRQG